MTHKFSNQSQNFSPYLNLDDNIPSSSSVILPYDWDESHKDVFGNQWQITPLHKNSNKMSVVKVVKDHGSFVYNPKTLQYQKIDYIHSVVYEWLDDNTITKQNLRSPKKVRTHQKI